MKWIREHDIVLRVLALLIAVLTWFYVIRTQNPDSSDTYSGISLQFEGIQQLSDNGLVITGGADTAVTVKLTGKRDRILLVSKDKIIATVNVSSITQPGEYSLNYTVSAQVDGVSLSSKNPTQVHITVDRQSTKNVPVKLKINGTLADGYQLASWSLSPDAIGLSGPAAALDNIDHAAATFDMSGKTDSGESTLSYTLVKADGSVADVSRVSTDATSTELSYVITRSDSVPLMVAFLDGDYLTEDMISYSIEPASIRVSGSSGTVDVINHIDLGSISLRNVLENNLTTVEMPIVLPNGVSEVEGEPTTATVTITTPGYARSVFLFPSENLPVIEDVTYPGQTLEFSLFGPEDTLAGLTAEDFTLTPRIDPAALTEGENILDVDVTVRVAGVKLLGKYTITAVYGGGAEPGTDPETPPEPVE